MDLKTLKERASIIRQVRTFFDDRGYLELDTPLLSPDLIPESCLEVFETHRLFPRGSKRQNQSLYLIPSPEIWMKKIIAKHRENVFQICKSFRNSECAGRLHNFEFTMLEYYTMNADYMDSLSLTENLIREIETYGTRINANFINSHGLKEKKEPIIFNRITVADAFMQYAGFDLFETAEKGEEAMIKEARRLGLDPMKGLSVPQLYDLIFIHAVEPRLNEDNPVALIDYPAFVPCLAKKAANGRTVERWELYWKGIELANCFSEEIDPQKIKEFFINEETEKKRSAIVNHKVDHDFWKMFKSKKIPNCSGVAVGLDRLIMALTGKSSIDCVLPFTQDASLKKTT